MTEDLRYAAVWTASQGGEWMDGPMAPDPFLQWAATRFADGYRVSSLQLVNVCGSLHYVGVVLPGDGGEFITAPLEAAEFASWYTSHFDQGYHLATVDMCVAFDKIHYGGTVREASGAQWFQPATDWPSFAAWATGLFGQGFRLTAFTTCVLFGQVLYSGVMTGGTDAGGQYMTPAISVEQFDAWAQVYFGQGYQLMAINGCVVDGQVRLAGVVTQRSGEQWLSLPLTSADFATQNAIRFGQGMHTSALSVFDLDDRYGWTPQSARLGVLT